MKKKNKKILLFSTLTLSMASLAMMKVQADEVEMNWTARSVDEIKADIQEKNEGKVYTIRYGDTLSTIAEALGIDMQVLANLNDVTNLDLIYPETVLRTKVDEKEQVTAIEVETPQANAEPTVVSADLEKNEIQVGEQTHSVEDLTQPIDSQEKETIQEEMASSKEAEGTPSNSSQKEEDIQEHTTTPAAQQSSQDPVQQTSSPTNSTPSTTNQSSTSGGGSRRSNNLSTSVEVASLSLTNTGSNEGLQPQTIAFKNEVAAAFGLSNIGGYRAGDQDHGKGLALDFMVPTSSALGDQIAQYAIQQMQSKGISYIIWKQRFYSPYPSIYGPANTWNPMPDRGSITANHYDHVHVSLNP
ncbi:LysM peptidoglycan-binding domain-containing protein [Streptococcus sp. DD13]|uniref:LysM peptidoglycan-binding domain-containing protein n=1 Tax=Streptococcus sp. DD13 TaxID=1777881 RepID=UPI000792F6F2|nr:LysM peptidoglycan-binding domain-containing protein [Streptococcus sp. DD13]KXT78966.1 surface immunogenic protein [Streptococcus sp. DD13]